jgi:hypothetical protein
MKSEAYIAIPMPTIEWFEGYEVSRSILYDTLDELNSLSRQLRFDLNEFGVSSPQIKFIEEDEREITTKTKLCQWFTPKNLEECEFLYIEIETSEIDKVDKEIQSTIFTDFFSKRITDLLLVANLCRPGSIEVEYSVILNDGQLQPYSHLPKINCWQLQRAVKLSKETDWPGLKEIPIKQAWEWAMDHKSAFEGYDSTPLGRAISAYSRLFETGKIDEAMHLVWSLIGIEALYVRGKNSIMEQVREKVYAFIGEPQTYKKKLAKMYEFRSRFIHGDLDFEPFVVEHDARYEIERHMVEQSEAIDTAVAVLAATLQEIIIRNWSGLDFCYVVSDSG